MKTTYKELWNDEYLTSFVNRIFQSGASNSKEPNLEFWFNDPKKGLQIDHSAFLNRFCVQLGIRNLVLGNDVTAYGNSVPVFVVGNRVEQMDTKTVKTVILKVLTIYDQENSKLGVDDAEDGEFIKGEDVITKLGF